MKTDSGLQIEILEEGDGPQPVKGQKVAVHYTGQLEDGTVFDSSQSHGEPIVFNIGEGQVIKGWDEGISQLKVGTKARLTIPPELAYGEQGIADVIPPDATLIFDVKLIAVD